MESDDSDLNSFDAEKSCDEDEGTYYVDSESSDVGYMLQSEEVELPQPSPPSTSNNLSFHFWVL